MFKLTAFKSFLFRFRKIDLQLNPRVALLWLTLKLDKLPLEIIQLILMWLFPHSGAKYEVTASFEITSDLDSAVWTNKHCSPAVVVSNPIWPEWVLWECVCELWAVSSWCVGRCTDGSLLGPFESPQWWTADRPGFWKHTNRSAVRSMSWS